MRFDVPRGLSGDLMISRPLRVSRSANSTGSPANACRP